MLPQSRSLAVRGVEAAGAYTLLRLWRDGADAGVPGQFFMLQADPAPADAYLPRPISAAWADDEELAFLLDIRGPGTRALRAAAIAHGIPCITTIAGASAAVQSIAQARETEPVALQDLHRTEAVKDAPAVA